MADQSLTLHLVTGPDYKPFTDPDLPMGGMHSQIVRAAFAKVGDKVDITFEPWARGYAETRRLAFDGTFPYVPSAEREKDFLYSDVMFVILSRAFVMADSRLTVATVDELADRTMCSPNGYVLPDKIQALVDRKAVKLERAAGMEECFKMLQMHRLDFVVCSDIQGRATSLRLWGKEDAVRPLGLDLAQPTHRLIVSREHPDAARIIADFNRGLAMLKASGEFDIIVKRQLDAYFGQITN
ncbi:MAG TPA: transporter substrate-binding domain-containing protein [Dongiaceae bacterium]|nr:transporter substrate-binding domain-containing protein [Dongiaceae bacterium]